MTQVRTIKSITGIQAFSNVSWHADDARKYNLVYGWNASGKSTIARVLSFLEHGTIHLGGFDALKFRIKTSDGVVSQDDLQTGKLEVRVYSNDFVQNNLSFRKSSANPIIILGEEHIEVEKTIRSLQQEIEELRAEESTLTSRLESIPDTRTILTKCGTAVAHEFAGTSLARNQYNARKYKRPQVQNLLDEERITETNLDSLIINDDVILKTLREQITQRQTEVAAPKIDLSPLQSLFDPSLSDSRGVKKAPFGLSCSKRST